MADFLMNAHGHLKFVAFIKEFSVFSDDQLKYIGRRYDHSWVNLYAIAFVGEFDEENKRKYGK